MKIGSFKLQVRHFTALVSAFIYNLNVFGLSARNICAPGFNCHGCPWATFSCPVGVIGYGFGVRTIPAFAIGSVLAIGLVLGRLVCGYACPVGLAQELIYKIPGKKLKLPRFFRYLKYIILFLTVFALTYVFGFEPTNAYIKVEKPVISSYPPAKKVQTGGFGALGSIGNGGASTNKFNSLGSPDGKPAKTFCPVPEGLLGNTGKNSINTSKSPANKFKQLNINNAAPSASAKPAFGSLSGKIGSLKQESAEPEPFHKSITQKTNLLKVEVEVINISKKTLDGFELTVAYYDQQGNVVWQAPQGRAYNVTITPGDTYSVPAFIIPNLLENGGLVVTSPQSNVKLDYWSLFCTYCPVAVFEADLPAKISSDASLDQMFYQTTRMNLARLVITLIIVIFCVLISRFFCRVICPLGAMYALLSKFSVYRIEINQNTCKECQICNDVCPVELDVMTEAGSAECIACGNCVKNCPGSAITRRFSLK